MSSDAAMPGDEQRERQDPVLIFANFDPDVGRALFAARPATQDWGPCDDAEHGMPFFQFMSRCALAAGAIAAAGAFFYYLEVYGRLIAPSIDR